MMTQQNKQKYYIIEKANAGLYDAFDPFGWMQWMGLPNAFAIGAFDEEAGRTVGIMVGLAEKEVLTILWLAVSEACQDKGVGEGFLRRAYELMESGQIPQMRVILDQAYEREPFTMNRQSFFTERLFSEGYLAGAHWVGTLDELSQLKYYREQRNEKLKPLPLREFSRGQVAEALSDFIGTKDVKMLYDVREAVGTADPDVSCFLEMEGEPCGGLLLRRLSEDLLLPVFFYAESDREADALVRFAYDRAAALYGKDISLSVVLWDIPSGTSATPTEKILQKLMERALPPHAGGARVLTVTLDDYKKFLREYHPTDMENETA